MRQLRRGDTLTIGEENFWIDRISPDDGGSCHLWRAGRVLPLTVAAERGCMAIKVLSRPLKTSAVSAKRRCPVPPQAINRVASSAISQSASQVARETKVRRKLVKERARLKRATVKNPQARIRVNRGDLPVIKLGNARIVLSQAS
ncbi:hypothetical protein ECZU12_49180 [Escherichia coli]|nr:hypothetical protein ECZU12_49180 [Escherichia coli]